MQKEYSRRAALTAIFTLAWPTVLEQILITAVSYVDTAMVGRYSENASAIVNCTMTVNWLLNGCVSALAIGFLSYIARAMGAQQHELVRRATAQATTVVLAVGALLTLLVLPVAHLVPVWMQADPEISEAAGEYFFIIYVPMLFRSAVIVYGTVLRASGDTKTPMVVNASTNVLNMVLNFFMIYPVRSISVFGLEMTMPGFGWGVSGAAIATSIAFTVGGIWMTASVFFNPRISPRGYSLKPDREVIVPCLRVALPALGQRIATSSGYVMFSGMINTLGAVATGAHGIANTAESAFYIPGYGMQAAASTLIGNAVGEKNLQKMRTVNRMLLIIEVLVMTVSGAVLFFGAEMMMGIFTENREIIETGAVVLKMVALSEPAYGVAVIMEGIFHGVGDTLYPSCVSTAGMWGVRILGTYIFVILLGGDLVSAWACMIAHNLLLCVMYCIRYARGRWNPLLKEKQN